MNPWPWYTHASLMSPFQCCRCTCGNPNHSWVHDGQAAWHAAPDAAAPAAPVPLPVPAPPPPAAMAPAGGPSPSMPSGPFSVMQDPGGAAGFANANAPPMPGADPNAIFYGGAAAPSGPQVSGMVGALRSIKSARVGPTPTVLSGAKLHISLPHTAKIGDMVNVIWTLPGNTGGGGSMPLVWLSPDRTQAAVRWNIALGTSIFGATLGQDYYGEVTPAPLQSLKNARVGPSRAQLLPNAPYSGIPIPDYANLNALPDGAKFWDSQGNLMTKWSGPFGAFATPAQGVRQPTPLPLRG